MSKQQFMASNQGVSFPKINTRGARISREGTGDIPYYGKTSFHSDCSFLSHLRRTLLDCFHLLALQELLFGFNGRVLREKDIIVRVASRGI